MGESEGEGGYGWERVKVSEGGRYEWSEGGMGGVREVRVE